jgi:hypothetical protein
MNIFQGSLCVLFTAISIAVTGGCSGNDDGQNTAHVASCLNSIGESDGACVVSYAGSSSIDDGVGGKHSDPVAGAAGIEESVGGSNSQGGSEAVAGETGEAGQITAAGSTSVEIGGRDAGVGGNTGRGGSGVGGHVDVIESIGGRDAGVGGNTGKGGASTVEGVGGKTETGHGGEAVGAGGNNDGVGGKIVIEGVGGSDPAVGGNTGKGGATGVGGMTTGNGGSDPGVGGATGVGGDVSVGGAASGGSGNGGTTGVGGATTGNGGSEVGVGGATGVGGTIACVPAARPITTDLTPAFTSCEAPVRDLSFAEETLAVATRVIANASDDIWVLANDRGHSYITHWNGSEWSALLQIAPEALDAAEFEAMSTDDSGNLWIAGFSQSLGAPKARIFRTDGTTLTEVSAGLSAQKKVFDVFVVDGRKFSVQDELGQFTIYELLGSAWTPMFSGHGFASHFWGTSATDIFIGGGTVDEDGYADKALLWHYDGCSWNAVELPSDMLAVADIHGFQGTVVVAGQDAEGAVSFVTTNLTDWVRYGGASGKSTSGAWMSSPTSFLFSESTGFPGDTTIGYGFTPWATIPFDTEDRVTGIWDIVRVGTSNEYVVVGGASGYARVYRMTCQ